jgi:hypothetical protein
MLIWIWTQPTDATVRAAISATYVVFFLLAAPVWCAAENRDRTYYPNNSTGLLVGCHLRQHPSPNARHPGNGQPACWRCLLSMLPLEHLPPMF